MDNKSTILVTGGTGYIGSHTVLQLLDSDYNVIILDNLCNSKLESLKRLKKISEQEIKFHQVDLLNYEKLEEVFKNESIDAVIHFAGLKAVGESVNVPLHYYKNNVSGTINLCEIMQKYNVKKMVLIR